MRKTFLLLIAVLAATAAGADVPLRKNAVKFDLESLSSGFGARKSAARKAVDYGSLQWKELGDGIFKDPVMCGMYGGVEENPVSVRVEVSTTDPGIYRVVNPWPGYSAEDDCLIIDATDPEYVIVPYQKTEVIDEVDGPVWIASVSWAFQQENIGKEEFIASAPQYNIFTEPVKVIVFPARSVLLRWAEAPPTSDYDTDPESFYYGSPVVSGYLVLPGGEYIEEWEDIGKGTMVDQVFAPIFQPEPNPVPYEVDVQKSRKREGIYRILDPWKNLAGSCSPVEIDMSQPDFVVIENQSTGISLDKQGIVYVMSGSYGWDKDEFLASEYAYENITLEGNRLLLPQNSIGAFLPEYDGSTLYFAEEKYGESYIDFPPAASIGGIASSSGSDAPAEYFNLQGMKVGKPEKGVYIRRQGSSAVKVMINSR